MNTKGKTSGAVWLIAVALVAIVVLGSWGITRMSVTNQAGVITEKQATGDCQNEPYVDLTFLNAENPGTSVTVSTNYVSADDKFLGNQTLGSAGKKFDFGSNVQVLASATNYLDTIVSLDSLKCGGNIDTFDIYATSAPTLTLYNSDNNPMTDSATGGATNQSASANNINLALKIEGTKDESTGNLYVVVETNDTEVDSISISESSGNAKVIDNDAVNPEFRTEEFSGNSITQTFVVEALVDGGTAEYNIQLVPETGKTIGASGTPIYVTVYSEQAYVDTDGSFKTGIEDSEGTSKYEDTADVDGFIV